MVADIKSAEISGCMRLSTDCDARNIQALLKILGASPPSKNQQSQAEPITKTIREDHRHFSDDDGDEIETGDEDETARLFLTGRQRARY